MSDEKTIRDMLQTRGLTDEIYEVRTFVGYRKHQRVTVRILDLGPDCDNPQVRFACKVETEDGQKATGNNAPTVDEAIAIVHWGDLD